MIIGFVVVYSKCSQAIVCLKYNLKFREEKMKKLMKVVVFSLMLIFPTLVFMQAKDSIYSGKVKLVIGDDERVFSEGYSADTTVVEGLRSSRIFLLETTSGYISLGEKVDWEKYINKDVSFSGSLKQLEDGTIQLIANEKSLKVTSTTLQPNTDPPVTQGNFKILVVPVTIQQPGQLALEPNFMTEQQALAPVFSNALSSKLFYKVASGDRLKLVGLQDLSGDVRFVSITSTVTNCDIQRLNEWVTASDQQLRLQGVEPNLYNSTIFVFNDPPGCSNVGYGTYGNIGLLNSREFISMMANTWLNFSAEYTVTHEIGHNLGLDHSRGYRCTDPNNIPASCTTIEYGDPSCVMGSRYFLLNVYQKHRLGWHDMPFKELTFSGNYRVYSSSVPVEAGSKRLMSCKFCYVPLSGSLTGYRLYYEARRSYGVFDVFSNYGTLMLPHSQGVKLLIGLSDLSLNDSRPYLIDTTPSDTTTNNSPLLLQSYTLGGVQTIHTSLTNITLGSGITVNLP